MPEDDAATTQIVGREFDDHSVGRNDADVVLPHLAADGRQDPMPISQFNSEPVSYTHLDVYKRQGDSHDPTAADRPDPEVGNRAENRGPG